MIAVDCGDKPNVQFELKVVYFSAPGKTKSVLQVTLYFLFLTLDL